MPKRSYTRTTVRSYKRGKVSASSKLARRVVGRGGGQYVIPAKRMPVSFSGGDHVVRRFRRMALDTSIYGVAGAVVQTNSATGLGAPWLVLGAGSTDLPSAPSLLEFGASTQFALTDVLLASQLQLLFNEFQINKVELQFHLDNAHAFSQGNGNTPNTIPSVYLRYDPNDSTLPATQEAVASGGDCEYHSLAKPFTYTFYPRMAIQSYANGVLPGFAAPANPGMLWLDTSAPSNSTIHYGVKMWWRNFQSNTATGLVVRVQPIFHMTFRRTR